MANTDFVIQSGDARPEICTRPEDVILLNLALPDPSPSAVAICHSILDAGKTLDWGLILDQATRHRILPAVARNFDRHALKYPSAAHRDTIRSALICNRKRNQYLGEEIGDIIKALNCAELAVLVRKGPYLAHCVYPDPSIRYMSDVDMLVRRDDVEAIEAVLSRMGYQQGRISDDRRTISPMKRQEALFWKLNTASLPPYVRLTGIAEIQFFMIDLRHGLLEPSSGKKLDMSDWFARAEVHRFFGTQVQFPCVDDFIIDVSVHIYREATTLAAIHRQRDICLSRYVDLLLLMRAAEVDPAAFAARVQDCGVAPEVYYAMHFLCEIYEEGKATLIKSMIRPASVSYLEEYGALDGHKSTWRLPFAERIFSPNRASGISVRSRLPVL